MNAEETEDHGPSKIHSWYGSWQSAAVCRCGAHFYGKGPTRATAETDATMQRALHIRNRAFSQAINDQLTHG